MSDNQSVGLSADQPSVDENSSELLGFDNVVFPIGDLGEAVDFYERAGFPVTHRIDEIGLAILKVGKETPGILLRVEEGVEHRPTAWATPRVWLEVRDARATGRALAAAGVEALAPPFSVATGWTVEVADPWGNVVGFTDYRKRPELARS
ncbi:VOC family protein [Streptomyces sp. BA2]|uniref:VOC family protein n=1 Tax=Streptomyces sp. BA2 TaxID=436595 RepID=UPI00132A0A26|nr:VOC family protein [Streptomyces sp. BA2]MWA13129.1 VOC family protein [Streptomyces sp. BA2]